MKIETFKKLDNETQRNLVRSMLLNYLTTPIPTHSDDPLETNVSMLNRPSSLIQQQISSSYPSDSSSLNIFQTALLKTNHPTLPCTGNKQIGCIQFIQSSFPITQSIPVDETRLEQNQQNLMLKLDIADFCDSYIKTCTMEKLDESVMIPNTLHKLECENTKMSAIRMPDATSDFLTSTQSLSTNSNFENSSPIVTKCNSTPNLGLYLHSSQIDVLNNSIHSPNFVPPTSKHPILPPTTFSSNSPISPNYNQKFDMGNTSLSNSSNHCSSMKRSLNYGNNKPEICNQPSATLSLVVHPLLENGDTELVTCAVPTCSKYPKVSLKSNPTRNTNMFNNPSFLKRRGFPQTKVTKSSAKQSSMQFHFPLWTFHSSSSMKNNLNK